jgi:hypothetical protein
MGNSIDKKKITDKIQTTKPQDLLYLNINPVETNSLKAAVKSIEGFLGKVGGEVVVIKSS